MFGRASSFKMYLKILWSIWKLVFPVFLEMRGLSFELPCMYSKRIQNSEILWQFPCFSALNVMAKANIVTFRSFHISGIPIFNHFQPIIFPRFWKGNDIFHHNVNENRELSWWSVNHSTLFDVNNLSEFQRKFNIESSSYLGNLKYGTDVMIDVIIHQ